MSENFGPDSPLRDISGRGRVYRALLANIAASGILGRTASRRTAAFNEDRVISMARAEGESIEADDVRRWLNDLVEAGYVRAYRPIDSYFGDGRSFLPTEYSITRSGLVALWTEAV
jgi:hypothetical protein